MRKYLLPEGGNFYKANLHCHTDVSDGALTPDEVKEAYKAHGYSIVAYTDHDVMIDHSDLADESFLPLLGYELEVVAPMPPDRHWQHTAHICLIALDPENARQVCWHRGWYLFGNAPKYRGQVKFDPDEPDYIRSYTPECLTDMMQKGRDHGFFVTWNHPAWSMETGRDYLDYYGMHAMEICNFGSYEAGYEDYVPMVYDEMLRGGRRIFCISADDNHNHGENKYHDSFGGFTVIKADKLDYRTVVDALMRGDFYASMGPEIHELYVEDGYVHIKCSPAERIALHTGIRTARQIWAKEGEQLTEASFKLEDKYGYFRLTVTDHGGRHANTNAYFMDEINE